ncbi:MAG: hypothetical protein LC109_11225, partial [Bacteroidia bacterium]|nr:hypothetical protein [Bacteroidia bacterium]
YVASSEYFCRVLAQKQYELSNHLGNVLATVLDRRTGVFDEGADTLMYYVADVVSATLYYPFGLSMTSYKNPDFNYEFDFNGKPTDDETGWQDYGFRVYSRAYGKFLSPDPLHRDYPWNSTYAFAENDVIRCIDLEGAERFIVIERAYVDEKGNQIYDNNDKPIIELIFVLDATMSVQDQAALGMMLFSFDGGQTFTNNYKYKQIADENPHFLNMYFDTKTGDLYTIMPDGKPYKLSSPHAGTIAGAANASQMKNQFEDGHIAPPQYSVRLSITDKTELQKKTNSYTAEFEGFVWGAATSVDRAVTYVSGVGVTSAKFRYNLGHSDYPNQTWNIVITDNVGNVIWSTENANTGGSDVEVDLTNLIPNIGVHTLKIDVTPSTTSQSPSPTSGSNVSTNFDFDLKIETQSYE